MKIRNATLLIILVVFTIFFAFLYLANEQIVGNSFGQLEKHEVEKNVKRADASLGSYTNNLAVTAKDWGNWDDTYNFVQGQYENYPDKNLDIDTLVNIQSNVMLFYNASGQLLYAVGTNKEYSEYEEIPTTLLEDVSSYKVLFSNNSHPTYVSGIIKTHDGTLLVASNPITPSTERENVIGTLIVGRYLNDALIEEIEETTELSLNVQPFNENKALSDLDTTIDREDNVYVVAINESSIVGTTLLNDVNGNPLLFLDIEMSRDIYLYGKSALNNVFIANIGIAVICGIILKIIVDKAFLYRIFSLKNNLAVITENGSLSSRVEMTGNDELKDLSDNINHMLAALEENETKFKQVEKENQQKLETVLSSVICGTLVIDAQTHIITDVNPMAIEIIGLPKEKIVGNACSNLLCPREQEDCSTLHHEILGNKSESVLVNADGKEIPIIRSIVPVSLFGKNYLVESFVDLKQLKETEKGLIESEEKLFKISNSAQDAIVMVDTKSIITFWNPAAEKIFGYTREEAMGKDIYALTAPFEYEDGYKNSFTGFIAESKHNSSQILSVNSRKKSGTEFPAEVSLSEFKLKNGSWNYVAIIRDITERKKAEEALIDAKVTAEMANRAKSEFLATMSHELRTPLNSIIGFSDLMLDGGVGEMQDMQKKFMGNISISGKHLLSLINNILDISKIEAGKMELNYELFDVYAVIDEVKQLVSPLADKKEIKFELTKDESLEQIYADRLKFKQILFNLASNAIKFTPLGGKVTISATKVQNKAQFSVKDTGIGISKDNQSKLFQPFKQIDSTTTRRYEGTGLGLSLVKRFVEMHKGKIWVESELGTGTTFIFEMPLKPDLNENGTTNIDHLPAQVSTKSAVQIPESRKSVSQMIESLPSKVQEPLILVVEDDDSSRELLEVTLKSEGYRVASAKNGKEALKLAEKMKPFAITLDIMMPEMNGWDVLKDLKENDNTKKIPVIITTMLEEHELGIVWGAADHFVKPIQKEALLAALERNKEKMVKSPLSVLVVDDEINAVELIVAMLADEGINVLTAYGGKGAIDVALEKLPDLIILDLMMPDTNGFDVIEVLKSKPETIDIPIIICTAKDLDSVDMSSLSKNVSSIIQKGTFTKEKLIELIKALQKRKRQ
ncbi:response regulator [uncultured Methanomethylovorans sp.]|uniref:response regulator n=1 Tax=uncultured Methanomethylovorans sp. TaxID=183759 RepID=UPI002AA65725|nr:response regulator [uncultured Methanomethylovorans sp.]